MIIVLSVPHTGTRFTCKFLEHIGVIYRQYHSEPYSVDALRWESDNKAIIPLQDPLLCFCSTFMRSNPDAFEKTLDNVVLNYALLMQMEGWFKHEYLRLDAKDKKSELKKIATFCDSKIERKFQWSPVGNINDTATDYAVWETMAKSLGPDKVHMVARKLQDAREHYGY